MKSSSFLLLMLAAASIAIAPGCALFPDKRLRPTLHNPFPQLKRVAVLPFFNQSDQPNIDTQAVAQAYYAALQEIPGFVVLPVGVAKTQWVEYSRRFGEPTGGADFQRLAQFMGVEAVVVGSVTDFEAYYPPRLAMTVHWYAANEGFHPIPPGYGLPWGTKDAEKIPARIVRETEFELARHQLATQTPSPRETQPAAVVPADFVTPVPPPILAGPERGGPERGGPERGDGSPAGGSWSADAATDPLLAGDVAADLTVGAWPPHPQFPDPTDLIPDPPTPLAPVAIINHEPVLTHTRLYRGDDPYVTQRLGDYVETGDDARPSGWQGYLDRSDDFIRFCCHLHLSEMLESRGGSDQSDLILRWPLSRY